MKKTIVLMCSVLFCLASRAWAEQPGHSHLSYQQALDLALSNPKLLAYEKLIAVQEGYRIQAGLNPNSSISLSAEEFPGLNRKSGEFTLQWQQYFPTSGRIEYNKIWTDKALELAKTEVLIQKKRVKRDLTKTYYALLSQQAYLKETQALLATAEKISALLAIQQRQGKILKTESTRARLFAADLRLQKQISEGALAQAQYSLQAVLMVRRSSFDQLTEPLESDLSTPRFLEQSLDDFLHPELEVAIQLQEQESANLDLQKSLTWPDLQWNLGLRYVPSENNFGAVNTLTWPLPLSNANQGNIQAAEEMLEKKALEKKAAEIDLFNRLRQSLIAYKQVVLSLHTYQNELLPLSEENLSLNQRSYEAGKLPYLAVLDAQRSVTQMKQRYILQWQAYYDSLAELEYFLGDSRLLEARIQSDSAVH